MLQVCVEWDRDRLSKCVYGGGGRRTVNKFQYCLMVTNFIQEIAAQIGMSLDLITTWC